MEVINQNLQFWVVFKCLLPVEMFPLARSEELSEATGSSGDVAAKLEWFTEYTCTLYGYTSLCASLGCIQAKNLRKMKDFFFWPDLNFYHWSFVALQNAKYCKMLTWVLNKAQGICRRITFWSFLLILSKHGKLTLLECWFFSFVYGTSLIKKKKKKYKSCWSKSITSCFVGLWHQKLMLEMWQ